MAYIPQKERDRDITLRYRELAVAVFSQACLDCHAYYSSELEREQAYKWLVEEGQDYLKEVCGLIVREDEYQGLLQRIRDKEGHELVTHRA